jgi:hypothetical protein
VREEKRQKKIKNKGPSLHKEEKRKLEDVEDLEGNKRGKKRGKEPK